MKQWIERAICIALGFALAFFLVLPNRQALQDQIDRQERQIEQLQLSLNSSRSSAAQTKASTSATAVYATPKGKKYHRADCRYVAGRNDLRVYASPEDAEEHNLGACSVCNP